MRVAGSAQRYHAQLALSNRANRCGVISSSIGAVIALVKLFSRIAIENAIDDVSARQRRRFIIKRATTGSKAAFAAPAKSEIESIQHTLAESVNQYPPYHE